MKNLFCLCVVLISSYCFVNAQETPSVKELIARGNSVFIEIEDKNNNVQNAYDEFKKHLLGDEWNKWELVESKEKADFVCRLHIEKTNSLITMGARVRVVTEILTPDGTSVWKSKQQQGNVSEFTGFNALADAMRKTIRKSLKKELYGEK